MNQAAFDQEVKGKKVQLLPLKGAGITAWITNYGARVVSLQVHDRQNKEVDVVVGFDSIKDYLATEEVYHGAIIGRFANRIAKGKFSLGGKAYKLNVNNGPNHLHGGDDGFHNQVWDVAAVNENRIVLTYMSKDGEEGYPGNMDVKVTYTLLEREIKIDYHVACDAETILNITNHSYFNLNGLCTGTVLNHTLEINSDGFTAIDETLIPYGRTEKVEGTPFDFRTPVSIGKRIDEAHEQIRYGKGYDHNYVLNKPVPGESFAARAIGDQSGIVMEVYTDQPGMQFYSGNFMEGKHKLKGGAMDIFRSAFCLETQHFPDSPNQPSFPSVILKPGHVFRSTTSYRFLVV